MTRRRQYTCTGRDGCGRVHPTLFGAAACLATERAYRARRGETTDREVIHLDGAHLTDDERQVLEGHLTDLRGGVR